MRNAPGIAALALASALVLGGCTEDQVDDAADQVRDEASQAAEDAEDALEDVDLPEVDWDRYGEELKEQIDAAAEQADCDQLEEMAQDEANDTEVTEYIKARIQEVC